MWDDRIRRLAYRLDEWGKPPYRRWASRSVEWVVLRISRVRLAAHVAYLALTGDTTFFAHWEARHIHGAQRFQREMNEARELARYRAALSGESGGTREAVKQLGALRVRVKEQARQIKDMQEIATLRNKQLDALHIVWCSGGCVGGVGNEPELTEEKVKEAVTYTRRLVTWWNNHIYRKHGKDYYEAHRVAHRVEWDDKES